MRQFFFEKSLSRHGCDINLKISVPRKTGNPKTFYIVIFLLTSSTQSIEHVVGYQLSQKVLKTNE